MGIISNQSIKNTFTTYLGFGIGGINTLFLYTHFLEKEQYGLVSYILTTSNLLWPLIALGTPNALVKFYSSYSQKEERDKFLSLVLLLPLLVGIILGLFGIVFYEKIVGYFEGANTIVQPYVWLIFATAIAMAYFELFFAWVKVQYKSVFGNFMKEVFHRFFIMVLLFMVYGKVMATSQFVPAVFGVYVIRTLIMKIYAYGLLLPKFRWRLPHNYTTVLRYASLIMVAGSVALLLVDLDKFMIEKFLPIGNVAVYSMYAYIASVIGVPSRAMHQIIYPLTAKLMNDNDIPSLHRLYKKSALNLLIVSGFVFLMVSCNVRQLYQLIPKSYELIMMAVLFIGVTKLYDSLLGNTNAILFSSDSYRVVLFLGLLLGVVAIGLNYWLIPTMGLLGAALATGIAVLCYNSVKLIFVYQKFGIHPFCRPMGTATCLILLLWIGFCFWDFSWHPVPNIAAKSLLITLIYSLLVYRLRLSTTLNDQVIRPFFRKFS